MKNHYLHVEEITEIYLDKKDGTQIKTVISMGDFEKVDAFPGKWCLMWNKDTRSYYVVGHQKKTINGRRTRKTTLLHRVVTEAPKNMVVDHINHNTLDNTRKNLRICTQAQNTQNLKSRRNSKSGIRGVCWLKAKNRWRARLNVNGKSKDVGYFKTLEEAECAVKQARSRLMPFSYEASNAQ